MAFIKRSKADVKSKKAVTLLGAKTKAGKKQKSGTVVTFNDGTTTTFLTPAGKATKFSEELRQGKHLTNEGVVKTDKRGREKRLKDTDRAYRAGFLAAQKAASEVHKAKNKGENGHE